MQKISLWCVRKGKETRIAIPDIFRKTRERGQKKKVSMEERKWKTSLNYS